SRERREPLIYVDTNGTPQTVRLQSSSVYYTMSGTGRVQPSGVMKRTKREPFANIMELPGRTMRMGESFDTSLNINLGTYIPTMLKIDHAQATIDGMEWEGDLPCVRLKVTYGAGDYKLTVLDQGIQDADFRIDQGTSTIFFSEKLGRIIRANHSIAGLMKAPIAERNPNAP